MSSPKAKVLIVDDHAVVREGLRSLINSENDFVVAAEAQRGPDALELISKMKFDIAVIDVGLEGMNGIELMKNIRARSPKLPVLVLSMYDEDVFAERALRAGAKGYLTKKEPPEKLIECLRKILGGKICVSAAVEEKIFDRIVANKMGSGSPVESLSDRELEVFQLIGQGFKAGQIAEKLNLSIKTVETYREQVKVKLNLEHASDLARYAIRWAKTENIL